MSDKNYDELPYFSSAFSASSPLRLEACATILGHTPPLSQSCRVLEIGSSFGGNLIPFALANPNATLVGIDISKEQVKGAQKIINELEIKNLKIIQQDICEFDISKFDCDEFDYIIAHGVYSWVPDIVKDAILDVIKKHLSPNGVAYISYNTSPGWQKYGAIRDFMRFSSQNATSVKQKIQISKQALKIYAKSLEKMIKDSVFELNEERELLSTIDDVLSQNDYYLAHEYLTPINDPIYFTDFVNDLHKNDLEYLCDTSLSEILKPTTSFEDLDDFLSEACPDRINFEQMVDICINQQFRRSLIVHKDVFENIKDKQIGPMDLNKVNVVVHLEKTENGFVGFQNTPLKSEFNWLYEIFTQIYPSSLNLGELFAYLDPKLKMDAYIGFLYLIGKENVGYMSVRKFTDIEYIVGKTRLKPSAKRYLNYFLRHKSQKISFANELNINEVNGVSEIEILIALKFDGKRSKQQIADEIIKEMADKQRTISINNKVLDSSSSEIRIIIDDIEKLLRYCYFFEEIV